MEPEIELGQLFYSSMTEKEDGRKEKSKNEGQRKETTLMKKIASCSINYWALGQD